MNYIPASVVFEVNKMEATADGCFNWGFQTGAPCINYVQSDPKPAPAKELMLQSLAASNRPILGGDPRTYSPSSRPPMVGGDPKTYAPALMELMAPPAFAGEVAAAFDYGAFVAPPYDGAWGAPFAGYPAFLI